MDFFPTGLNTFLWTEIMNTMRIIEWKKTKRLYGFLHCCIPPAGKPSLFIYSKHDDHTHPYQYTCAVVEHRYLRITFIRYAQIRTIEKPSNLVNPGYKKTKGPTQGRYNYSWLREDTIIIYELNISLMNISYKPYQHWNTGD